MVCGSSTICMKGTDFILILFCQVVAKVETAKSSREYSALYGNIGPPAAAEGNI